ncbi:MAG: zinc ribbon domain-containing protein [Candidatus Aminicenantes bacterium]|nr:zinc ribbon domain-containing protein [Candidatus Aminicenantes bacterium]
MPLYEYECSQCGHAFEVVQKAHGQPLKKCPKCSGPLRKLLSAPAIHFKGSGWYITDYAKKSSGEADKAPAKKSEPAAGSESKETKKDESPSK